MKMIKTEKVISCCRRKGWMASFLFSVVLMFGFSSCVFDPGAREEQDELDALTYMRLNVSLGKSKGDLRVSFDDPTDKTHPNPEGTMIGFEEFFITDILYFLYELDWEVIDPSQPHADPYTPNFTTDPNIRFYPKEGGAVEGFHLTQNQIKGDAKASGCVYTMNTPHKVTHPGLVDKYVGIMVAINPEPQMMDRNSGLIAQAKRLNDGAAFMRLFSPDEVDAKNSSDLDPLYQRTNTFHPRPQYFDYSSYFEGKDGVTGAPVPKFTVKNRIPMTGFSPSATQHTILFLKNEVKKEDVKIRHENEVSINAKPVVSRVIVTMSRDIENVGIGALGVFGINWGRDFTTEDRTNLFFKDVYAEVVNGEKESFFFAQDEENPEYKKRGFSPHTRYSSVVDGGIQSFSWQSVSGRQQAEDYMLYFDRRYTQANQLFPNYVDGALSLYEFGLGETQGYAAVKLSSSMPTNLNVKGQDANGIPVGSPGFFVAHSLGDKTYGYELMDAWHTKNLGSYSPQVQDYYMSHAKDNARNRVPFVDDDPMAVFPTINGGGKQLSIPYVVPNLWSHTGFDNNEKLYASVQTTGMYPHKISSWNSGSNFYGENADDFFVASEMLAVDKRTPNIMSVFFGENAHPGGKGDYRRRNTVAVLFTVIAEVPGTLIQPRKEKGMQAVDKILSPDYKGLKQNYRLMMGAPLTQEMREANYPPGMKSETEVNFSAYQGGCYNSYLVLAEDGKFYHSIYDATHDDAGNKRYQRYLVYRTVYRTIGGNVVPHPYVQISNLNGENTPETQNSFAQNVDYLNTVGNTNVSTNEFLPPPFALEKKTSYWEEFLSPPKDEALNYSKEKYSPCIVMYYLAYLNPDDIYNPSVAPTRRNTIYHIHISSFKSLGMNYNPLSLYGRFNTTHPYDVGKWQNAYGAVKPFGQYFRDYDPVIDLMYYENNFGGVKDGPGTPYDPNYYPSLPNDIYPAPEDHINNNTGLNANVAVYPWIQEDKIVWEVPYSQKRAKTKQMLFNDKKEVSFTNGKRSSYLQDLQSEKRIKSSKR